MNSNEEKVAEVNSDEIVTENVSEEVVAEEPVNETVQANEPTNEIPTQEEPILEVVKPVKRRKKDIIGYNPETGEPIYKEIVLGMEPEKKSKKGLIIAIIIALLVIGTVVGILLCMNGKDDEKPASSKKKKKENQTEQKEDNKPKEDEKEKTEVVLGDYKLLTSSIGDYDLYFLKIENKEKNQVYSPLSIKYALEMLNEGTDGETHKQISEVVGKYVPKKYANSSNMSFANALFINNEYKDTLEQSYVDTLKNKYNAEVILDEFNGPATINNWVKEKTLNLIENLLDDVDSDEVFVLVNALGIDMEWKNPFHKKEGYDGWYVYYPHLKFYANSVQNINMGYPGMSFNGIKDKYFKAVSMVGLVNNYDVVKTVGEKKIREEVGASYQEWLDKGACGEPEKELSVDEYLDKYISEIDSSYGKVDVSTDFEIYTDDDVIAFAKDLKEYDDTTLEFVAIMPKEEKLTDYVNTVTGKDLSKIIDNLKEINKDNFSDDKITYIHGQLPIFDYEYQLDLINDLNKMGITNVFDLEKADLSKISSKKKLYIADATHKATISLSNDGIKAAAATAMGGKGAAGCRFDYYYEPPVDEIDITFNKPYLYLIIDKDTKEVWFVGTVYEPTEYTN